MGAKTTKSGSRVAAVPKRGSARPAGFGKQLDPALKSWLDNVIIPALVRQYELKWSAAIDLRQVVVQSYLPTRTGKTMTLRCAAYARYSSDLQSPRSIEDQLRICREYAHSHGFTFLEEHVYADEALSGVGADRPWPGTLIVCGSLFCATLQHHPA